MHENERMTSVEFPKPGYYRHFKGNLYCVLGYGTEADTNESVVIYRACYGNHRIFVRTLDSWTRPVNRGGQMIERFKREKDMKRK